MGRGSFEEELLSKIASGELGRFQQGSEETRVEPLIQTQCSREDRRPSSPQRPGQPHGPGGRGLPVRVSADPMIKAGSLGKRPKGTGHASGQDRPWRTGDSTGENRRPGAGAPLAPPPRRARAPARPTLRYARGAPAVSLPPSNQGRTLSPWLRDRSVSVLSVNSFRLGGASATTLRNPARRQAPGPRLELFSGGQSQTQHATCQDRAVGPACSSSSRPLSPDEGLSILRPQHGLTSFVHSDHVGAGGGPGHCVDRRASKGEVGTRVRPQ